MIGFIGLSHLGINSSIGLASKGFQVLGFDPDANLASALSEGKFPVFEPGLEQLYSESKKQINFTSDPNTLQKCDLVYISLDVKTNDDNTSDLSSLEKLILGAKDYIRKDAIVVLLSQVPPGFSRKLKQRIGLNLFYQVETLIFGRAVERTLYPERYIVGSDDPSKPLPGLFQEVLGAFKCPILHMRFESAELAKISINACLVSSISVANTLSEICEKIGASWDEIAPALKLDKRIGAYSYLSPGLGIAGGNLERDLVNICAMGREHGTDTRVVEAWQNNNKYRQDWVLRGLHQNVFGKVEKPVIAVLGLAYKKDTKSIKNSPSIALLEQIKDFKVQCYDPQVILQSKHENQRQCSTAVEACQGADCVVVMTPWDEFKQIDLAKIRSQIAKRVSEPVILDPLGTLDGKQCREAGFRYFKLGVST